MPWPTSPISPARSVRLKDPDSEAKGARFPARESSARPTNQQGGFLETQILLRLSNGLPLAIAQFFDQRPCASLGYGAASRLCLAAWMQGVWESVT